MDFPSLFFVCWHPPACYTPQTWNRDAVKPALRAAKGKRSLLRMKGIQFVVDGTGKKKAVLIDLEEWGKLWEDIYDVMVSHTRKDEPTVLWDELKAELKHQERPSG